MSILKALNQLVGLVRVDPDVSIDDAKTLTEKCSQIAVAVAATAGTDSAESGGIGLGKILVKRAILSQISGSDVSLNADNYADVTLYATDGSTDTTIATYTTKTADWTSHEGLEMTLTATVANRTVAADQLLCAVVTKEGTGVATPAGLISIAYEEVDA